MDDGMKYYFLNKSKEEIAEIQRVIDECYANVIKDRDNVSDEGWGGGVRPK